MFQGLIDGLLALLVSVFPGFAPDLTLSYNGYLEGEFRYIAPAAPGRITELAVKQGQSVEQGSLLFRLDDAAQQAQLHAAEAHVAAAKANLENLQTGSRQAEIAVLQASLKQAEADRGLAIANLEISRSLVRSGSLPATRLTTDQAHFEAADARVAQLKAQLVVAELPARQAQREASQASLRAAEAQLEAAQTALADRLIVAPAAGLIDAVWFEEGEVAATGTPVLSLLPNGPLKAIFFVPEDQRASLTVGQSLALSCDGCAPGLRVKITTIASQPQYSPPLIYSREQRQRLVFMVEARLLESKTPGANSGSTSASNSGLNPGQPISVEPLT